jgi:hypothetical protein
VQGPAIGNGHYGIYDIYDNLLPSDLIGLTEVDVNDILLAAGASLSPEGWFGFGGLNNMNPGAPFDQPLVVTVHDPTGLRPPVDKDACMLLDAALAARSTTALGSRCFASRRDHHRRTDTFREKYFYVRLRDGRLISLSRFLCALYRGAPVYDRANVRGGLFNLQYERLVMPGLMVDRYQEPEVMHLCNRKGCCNPKHLDWGFRIVNLFHHLLDRDAILAQDSIPQWANKLVA